ncbi:MULTISPECIES: hypothetical protein [Rhizobium/Agrobacterium group]|uniref:hypothetical protein n=1 Tax=Rhizobium/Agrobacterium group TaxID=227290 RepID=UPI0007879074|nr:MULTISPECIES: hypothetical protein [Rhizobium/Agrobacterium group]
MPDIKSPAVQSLESEQSEPRVDQDDLRDGLEDTFPASDPVSATGTTTSGAGADAAEPVAKSDAPRVDEALESILAHRNDPYSGPKENIVAVRQEVSSLGYRTADDLRRRVRENPMRALGLGAIFGYLVATTLTR